MNPGIKNLKIGFILKTRISETRAAGLLNLFGVS